MKLFNEETIDQILDGAWQAYKNIQSSIRTLESIGLSVDGCRDDTGRNMSSLFSALSSVEDAIFAALSVPDDQTDRAAAIFSAQYEAHQAETRFPDSIRTNIQKIDTAGAVPEHDTAQYDVTVTITGMISAWSHDEHKAMEDVRELTAQEILRQANWNGVDVTDSTESFHA